MTAVASREARTIKKYTERSSNYQSLNNPVDNLEVNGAASNSADYYVPSTSHKEPLSNAMNRADAAADPQPSNADEKGPRPSREQPLNKLVNEGDAALDKQRSNPVEESSSSCTSSQRKPLADDKKENIQEVFRDIIRSIATRTM